MSVAFSLLIFSVLSLVVVRLHAPRRLILWGVVICMVFGGLLVGGTKLIVGQSNLVRERMDQMAARDVRIYNWRAALDQFHLSPAFGTGAGTHLVYGRLFRRKVQLQTVPGACALRLFGVAGGYGIAGAVLMALFLCTHIHNGCAGLRRATGSRVRALHGGSNTLALDIGALAAVAAYLVHSTFDFNLHIPGNALLFAFLFGVLSSPMEGAEGAEEMPAGGVCRASFRVGLVCVGVAILLLGWPKVAGEWYAEQSRVALRDGAYYDAISLAEKGLAVEKRNPDLYFYMGEANRLLAPGAVFEGPPAGRYEEAVKAYRKGLELFPNEEKMLVGLGQSLDGLQKFDEGDKEFQEAVRWDPNSTAVHEFYSKHYEAAGKPAEAKAEFWRGHSGAEGKDD